MMAPLKVPSIDSELPSANRTCGCAAEDTVKGVCEMARGEADGAAVAGPFEAPVPISRAAAATATRAGRRALRDMVAGAVFMGWSSGYDALADEA